MSLTQAQEVFGGVHENGINDLLRAFFSARPRHLHYGSNGFVPTTSVAATQISAIPFPGVPGGIDWFVGLSVPIVDLHPQTTDLPPELSMTTGQLSVATEVHLCIACESVRRDVGEKHGPDRRKDPHRGKAKGSCFDLKVFALGHLERVFGVDGESVIVVVDAVELVDIKPNEFESVIECLMLQVLGAVLADVRLPMRALRAGAFSLTLVSGPDIEDDQVKVYGNI